jgi:hypothetical protein
VHYGTAAIAECAHAEHMNLLYVKGIVAMAWTCSVLTVGLLTQASSVTSLVTLAFVAALPPTILMHRWREPAPSISQDIQKALR